MCGICGYAGFQSDADSLERMVTTLEHRGPDDGGIHVSGTVGLGMRRLSIIDVQGGRQPMLNEDGTVAVVFNGEIYNYREISKQLASRGHRIRTRSDTETILHLWEDHGPECVDLLRGMFAFAIHDARTGTVFLARDRLGIKPLYYWHRAGKLVFASETKAILQVDDVSRDPYLPAVDGYLSLRYVPGPRTMLTDVLRLPAGHRLTWSAGEVRIERYWEAKTYAGPYQSDAYYQERFSELFEECVRMRLMSEVPIGAYLSGGLDSSVVVASMASMMDQPVKTFSVGFGWKGDELGAAREVSAALSTDHTEVRCGPEHLELLPEIVWHSDDPLGDAIVVPTYRLAQEASKAVKVVLTGEGADETLAGYMIHKAMNLGHLYDRMVPFWVRDWIVEPAVARAPVALLDMVFDYPGTLGINGKLRALEYLRMMRERSPSDTYRFLMSLFGAREKSALYAAPMLEQEVGLPRPRGTVGGGVPFLAEVLQTQFDDWLPDNILLRQDKMSMAHGLEARVPFLDHALVEFLQTVPPRLKIRHLFTDKHLLRRHSAHLVGRRVSRRRKKAFYYPVESYTGHSAFQELVRWTLAPERVKRRGYFEPTQVRSLVQGANSGDFLLVKQVMALVILELWHMEFVDRGQSVTVTSPRRWDRTAGSTT